MSSAFAWKLVSSAGERSFNSGAALICAERKIFPADSGVEFVTSHAHSAESHDRAVFRTQLGEMLSQSHLRLARRWAIEDLSDHEQLATSVKPALIG